MPTVSTVLSSWMRKRKKANPYQTSHMTSTESETSTNAEIMIVFNHTKPLCMRADLANEQKQAVILLGIKRVLLSL